MKKFTKLFVAIMLVVVSIIGVVALAGCGKKVENPVYKEMQGATKEEFAFCVKKGNATLLTQLNEFFALESTKELIQASMDFHNGVTETPVQMPNLSDNKGVTITMVTEAGFAPYEYSSEKNGIDGVAGLDVDLMAAFCELNGYKLTVKNIEFATIPEEVGKSENNVGAAGMTITEDRKEKVDFATPYVESVQYIISDEKNSYDSLEDLKGLNVGVQANATGDLILQEAVKAGNFDAKNIKSYNKVSAAFQDFLKGTLDAVLIDKYVAIGLVKQYNK